MVSIIVPVYNVIEYIDKCIISIIQQTYVNLEIILVDDGSTDGSEKICDAYAKKDERVRVIHKPNGGLSDARNVGIDKSNGEYIAFVDADDYIELTFVENMLNEAKKNNSDIVQCAYERVYQNGKCKQYIISAMCIDGNKVDDMVVRKRLNSECFDIAPNKLYKRKLWENIRFPKGRIHEDYATIYKIIYLANRMTILDQVLYYYVQREGSITATPSLNSLEHWALGTKERSEFYNEKQNTFMEHIYLKHYFYILLNCLRLTQDEIYKQQIIGECKKIFNEVFYSKYIKLGEKIGLIVANIRYLR